MPDQIIAANTDRPYKACPARNGADTIYLIRDFVLSEKLQQITGHFSIEGNGCAISGDNQFRIFDIDGGMLTVKNLTRIASSQGMATAMRHSTRKILPALAPGIARVDAKISRLTGNPAHHPLQREQSKARMGKDMKTDQRQKLIRDLKESSSLLSTAADLLMLVSESPEEETSEIIIDLVQRARDLIDGAELLEYDL